MTTVALLFGCGGEIGGDDVIADDAQALTTTNGVALNGVALNGVALNGVALNGVALNGVALNGVTFNGVALNGVALNGSQLTGTLNGSQISGQQFGGSIMTGTLASGGAIRLKITSAEQVDANRWKYRVQYETNTGWRWLCVASDGAHSATALSGTWNSRGDHVIDSTRITLACNAAMGALGKCVDFGYRPWASYNGTNLANHHQACTRMIRGDYCGDGVAHTTNGRVINLFDNLGIQLDTHTNSYYAWRREAQWGTGGATCFDSSARAELDVDRVPCALSKPTCNFSWFPAGSYLANWYNAAEY